MSTASSRHLQRPESSLAPTLWQSTSTSNGHEWSRWSRWSKKQSESGTWAQILPPSSCCSTGSMMKDLIGSHRCSTQRHSNKSIQLRPWNNSSFRMRSCSTRASWPQRSARKSTRRPWNTRWTKMQTMKAWSIEVFGRNSRDQCLRTM